MGNVTAVCARPRDGTAAAGGTGKGSKWKIFQQPEGQARDVDEALHGLASDTSLRKFTLTNKDLDITVVRRVVDALLAAEHVRIVDLSWAHVPPEGGTELARLVREHKGVHTLKLDRNELGADGCVALMEALCDNHTIKAVDVSWNAVGDRGATAIGDMLARNHVLRDLDVHTNGIGEDGIRALAEGVRASESLKSLQLGDLLQCHLPISNGVNVLAEAIGASRSLRRVVWSWNSIGNAGAAALGRALASNTNIEELEINDDDIGDEGVMALAASLSAVSGHKIRRINLQDNIIADRGAEALAGVLGKFPQLTVDLSYNRIGIAGHKALLPYESRIMLEENPCTQAEAPLS